MSLGTIDFAPRRRRGGWLLAAAVVAALMAAWSAWELAGTRRAAAEVRDQAAALRARPAVRDEATTRAVPLAPEQLKAVNEAIQALNVPWPEVLGAVESSRGAQVLLVRVEPRPKDRTLLVVAQAQDMGALVGHMQQLARTAPFVKAVPVRQEVLADAALPLRVQATFEASWEDRP